MQDEITPDMLLQAYAVGIFPMAQGRHDRDIDWYDPPMRGIMPIADMHVPERLARKVRQFRHTVTFDRAFTEVMHGCASARKDTWISDRIIALYSAVHHQGFAHSVEVWDGTQLVGGIYGIALGGAFFGESMFSRQTDASKIALVHLTARLWRRGFTLFDAQFVNEHLLQFGCGEITRLQYQRRLKAALALDVRLVNRAQHVNAMDYSEASVSTKGSSGVSGAGVFSSPCLLSEVSGAAAGSASPENFSDFADVEAFLQSISQTS